MDLTGCALYSALPGSVTSGFYNLAHVLRAQDGLRSYAGALTWVILSLQAGWQRHLHDLPNHIFDASSPARRITASQRVTSLATKALELGAVGTIAGTAMSGLAQVLHASSRTVSVPYMPLMLACEPVQKMAA